MKTLAVTGGIGSGKSLVCSEFHLMGVPVYDSDSRAKSLYDKCPWIVRDIESALGRSLRDGSGRLDRRLLASIVFSDAAMLERLESVVHPYVLKDFEAWREEQSRCPWNPVAGTVPFVVIESAIILAKPLFRGVADKVMLVDAPVSVREKRAAERDGVALDIIRGRMSSQTLLNAYSDGKLVPDADFVLENDADEESLRRKVREICHVLWL